MCLTPLTPALVDGPRLLVQVVGVGLAEVERFGVWHGRAVQRVGGVGGTQRQPWSRQGGLGAALGVPLGEKQHRQASKHRYRAMTHNNYSQSLTAMTGGGVGKGYTADYGLVLHKHK